MSFTSHIKRKAQFATITTEPTLTDQSGAEDTLITTIVKRATISGQIPTTSKEPQYLDWRQIPTNMVDMIKMAKSAREAKTKLPKALRQLTDEQLYKLTYDQLKSIMEPKPAEPPTAPNPEPKAPEGEKK